MGIGKIKWSSVGKGYGFITSDESKDIFVHCPSIQSDGFRTLEEGQAVNLDVVESDHG